MKNEEFNIFSSSAHKKKPAISKKPQATPTPDETIPTTTSNKQEDVDAMLKRMHDLRQDLQTKLESTYTKSGITPKVLENYVSTMSGDRKSEIDKEIEKLEDKITAAIGSKTKKRMSYKVSKATKSRKGKMLGARKKWIPMK